MVCRVTTGVARHSELCMWTILEDIISSIDTAESFGSYCRHLGRESGSSAAATLCTKLGDCDKLKVVVLETANRMSMTDFGPALSFAAPRALLISLLSFICLQRLRLRTVKCSLVQKGPLLVRVRRVGRPLLLINSHGRLRSAISILLHINIEMKPRMQTPAIAHASGRGKRS